MEQELITIVVPVYNVEKFLPKCVENIIGQSYKNLEIILVDDGSTDSCPLLCDKFQKDDERVKVIHKKNGGLSDARNKGIESATGKYLTVIDSDDYVSSDFIEYLYKLLETNSADISVCQRMNVSEEGKRLGSPKTVQDLVINGNNNCMKAFFTNEAIDTVAWGKLYKTELFNDVKYPYGKYHEDVYTTYLLISKCNKIAIGSEAKYYYRQRSTSISKSSFQVKHLDAVDGAIQRSKFINKNYPNLSKWANAGIIYAANQCSLKMIKASCVNKTYISFLQKQYRKYELDFLKGKNGVKAKVFSFFAYINLWVLITIMTSIRRN